MSDRAKDDQKEVPDVIIDAMNNVRYRKGKFLGKGGFARCYEMTREGTTSVVAGKIVSKLMLMRKGQREKVHIPPIVTASCLQMMQEIQIQRDLSHPNVVGFYSYFEDVDHVFVVLELCARRVGAMDN